MNTNHNNYCILLAGGVGKRLWPHSTSLCPKQFIDFFGTGKSLLQHTFERVSRIIPSENIYISTYERYIEQVRTQLPQISLSQILTEPVQMSTAAAVAWANIHIVLQNPKANILVTPCDQLVLDAERYVSDVQTALSYTAESDKLLALGVQAATPNTAYGYVQTGNELSDELYTIRSFSEKPDTNYAKTFVESGEFLWNTGLFAWNAQSFIAHLPALMPQLAESLESATADLRQGQDLQFVKTLYPTDNRTSIDLVILSHTETALIKRCSFGWADIGSWPQLYDNAEKDPEGNVVLNDAKAIFDHASHNLVSLPAGQLAVIDRLDGYLVAQHNNVLLICPNDDPALAKKYFKDVNSLFGGEYV
ncbi:MAG: NTP transferase domain-containing protein [Alloprevotella sp.]|nr:NTP transferase domain-containing protein [Alloprevotella sp.]